MVEAPTERLAQLWLAAATGPDHPDRFDWYFLWGQGLRRWADYGDPLPRQDEAIAWLERLLGETEPVDERDVAELASLRVHRFQEPDRRHDLSLPTEVDRLVSDLEGVRLSKRVWADSVHCGGIRRAGPLAGSV